MNRRESLRADSRARFPNGCGETHGVAPQRGGEGSDGCEEGGDAGTHFAERVEDAVEDDEEGEYCLLRGGVEALVVDGTNEIYSSVSWGFWGNIYDA